MRMDVTVTGYPTYADLEQYMYGWAAVIGLQMVPILEPLDDAANRPARTLGEAFQLTNFVRDVAEDLRRGRVYLPQEDLDRFGVTRADLAGPKPSDRVRTCSRSRWRAPVGSTPRPARHRPAAPDQPRLHPTAFRLYGGILDEVERVGYRILDPRVSVPVRTRLRVAAPALLRARRARRSRGPAWLSRRPHQTHQASVCTTSENPKSRSSTGANATRTPTIAPSS